MDAIKTLDEYMAFTGLRGDPAPGSTAARIRESVENSARGTSIGRFIRKMPNAYRITVGLPLACTMKKRPSGNYGITYEDTVAYMTFEQAALRRIGIKIKEADASPENMEILDPSLGVGSHDKSGKTINPIVYFNQDKRVMTQMLTVLVQKSNSKTKGFLVDYINKNCFYDADTYLTDKQVGIFAGGNIGGRLNYDELLVLIAQIKSDDLTRCKNAREMNAFMDNTEFGKTLKKLNKVFGVLHATSVFYSIDPDPRRYEEGLIKSVYKNLDRISEMPDAMYEKITDEADRCFKNNCMKNIIATRREADQHAQMIQDLDKLPSKTSLTK